MINLIKDLFYLLRGKIKCYFGTHKISVNYSFRTDIPSYEVWCWRCGFLMHAKVFAKNDWQILLRDISCDRYIYCTKKEMPIDWNEPIVSFKEIPDYGDKFLADDTPVGEYLKNMNSDDGSGCWATDTKMSNVSCFKKKPEWATHYIWFNK